MADANPPDVFGPLPDGERSLWHGRCAVAEYAFDQAASLPRWTLPETTEVLVTNRRIRYAHTSRENPDDLRVTSGEVLWYYPEHIRVQPGPVVDGRPVAATQLQLVCAGADGSFPALVFAGGELGEVSHADKVANVIRHAIARFRVNHAGDLGLSVEVARELAKMLVGPEFVNAEGGDGQTVTLIGALSVPRQAPEATQTFAPDATQPAPPAPAPQPPPAVVSPPPSIRRSVPDSAAGYEGAERRAARAADGARALQASAAEVAATVSHPDLATRAANIAARISELVSGRPDPAEHAPHAPAELTDGTDNVLHGTIINSSGQPVSAPPVYGRPTSGPPAYDETPDFTRLAYERPNYDRLAFDEPVTGPPSYDSPAQYGPTSYSPPDYETPLYGRPVSGVPDYDESWPTSGAPVEGDESGTDLTPRAERVRRATARFNANSARGKASVRRPEHEPDGNRTY
ncbi:hypothetical protein GCM10010435_15900 [Winogradskya consettensis]|uniref:Translation initiation factor 2 n=1 Tax=Winogradskya consettensis TaxID=113560 RepID=A0A919SCW3_9ACTN|nr:hypothetical protein [Actinoplanes consettensis]GIM69399.1 hypothetical protein Aco04nite_15170 [Actinoplanes consettensis]